MKAKEFSDVTREINKQYRTLFGYIPSIRDYSCTQEQYIVALEKAVKDKKELYYFLVPDGSPLKNINKLGGIT